MKSHSKALVFFAVAKQFPVVYSAGRGRAEKSLLLWSEKPMILEVDRQHRVFEYYQVFSNYVPGLTLTYFTARSNLVPYAIVWEKR